MPPPPPPRLPAAARAPLLLLLLLLRLGLGPAPTLASSPPPPPHPPLAVSLTVGEQTVLPAHGSHSGIWFYADPTTGSQLLLLGHASVPESWRFVGVLPPHTEARLVFTRSNSSPSRIAFHPNPGPEPQPECRNLSNVLVLTSGPRPTVTRLDRFRFDDHPAGLAPQRRPFSRAPVASSPPLDPAIAEALIEWDWHLQDGIHTPREPRTHRQALEPLQARTAQLVAQHAANGTLTTADQATWQTLAEPSPHPAPNDADDASRWLALHRFRRTLLLADPQLRQAPILFAKHVPSIMSHQLTQMYGYCARPGGGLFVLAEPGRTMRVRNLTPSHLTPGNFMTPELSFDARVVFFAYCPVPEAPTAWDHNPHTRHLHYHLHSLALDSGEVHPLTHGDTDNFSPVPLPSGDLLFVSTRRGGYHRCGRGPCFVYTLARMNADGTNPRSVSFHETHEWDPCLLHDGRVIYTRWDYVDRNAVHYEHLWTAYPDGSGARIYYGNNTWNPTGLWEARSIPGSTRVMATAAPHHGMSAGSIVLLDPSRGLDGPAPLTRLTPDARFPESESPLAFGPDPTRFDFDTPITQYWRAPLVDPDRIQDPTVEERRWPGHCYKASWPLSETRFIVSYSYDPLVGEPGPNLPNMFGLYFADAAGNKELLYRDPAISSLWARPINARTPPLDLVTTSSSTTTTNTTTNATHPDAPSTGTFLLRDIRESWPYLPQDSPITHLRVLQVLLKTTPHADNPRVGAAFAAPGKQVLGTVPVEPDGSAWFEVPARTPVLFQALDAQGRAVQTMRSLVYLQPGERQTCIGCHEHRLKSTSANHPVLALQRPPSVLQPGPDGSRPFGYPRLVQPVLDRHCVRCHDGTEQTAGRSVLTGEPAGSFTRSYNTLVEYVAFSAWNRPHQNFEPLTEPRRFGAIASPLNRFLEPSHYQVRLDPSDWERLNTWMDANALFYGTFDTRAQAEQLAGKSIPVPAE